MEPVGPVQSAEVTSRSHDGRLPSDSSQSDQRSFAYRWFFVKRRPLAWYLVKMWFTSFIIGMAIAIPFALLLSDQATSERGFDSNVLAFFAVVVFSPVVETLLMGPVLWLIRLFTAREFVMATWSAIVWAAAHSTLHPVWGFGVAWPFFTFSCVYLAWRPDGWRKAVAITATLHALHNVAAFSLASA